MLDDLTLYQKNTGTVTRKATGRYAVETPGGEVVCEISPRLRKLLVYPIADPNSRPHIVDSVRDIEVVDPVAVGDQVRLVDLQDGSGLIVEVLPRRSKLSRLSAGKKPLEQVVVANLDQVAAVFSAAQPEPKWNLLDRYLVSAESLELPALILITKLDLLDDPAPLLEQVEVYRRAGYRVILTSAHTRQGLAELKPALQGRLTVLVGKSGVGKTSLLNALQPGLGLRVSQVNQTTGKGRHTTTNLAMFPLDGGGQVVDTPGMREFGLWERNLARGGRQLDLALYFPEMRSLVGTCRFGLDCSHSHEPGCTVRQKVQSGFISAQRYESFLRLQESL
jgi:ribosome biogenesis GTPase / thiamine phosphate phosphatase